MVILLFPAIRAAGDLSELPDLTFKLLFDPCQLFSYIKGMEEFITYRHFYSEESAMEVVALLKANAIESQIQKNFPRRITTKNFLENFILKIRPTDFEKANELVLAQIEAAFEHEGEDYYLHEFTDEELLDVIKKRDEWAEFDFLMAQSLLKKRGKEVTPELLQDLRDKRIEELNTPKKASPKILMAGYLFVLLGGFIAIGIGYNLFAGKRTLPNGERIHEYSSKDREHGFVIFIGGFLVAALGLSLRFFRT